MPTNDTDILHEGRQAAERLANALIAWSGSVPPMIVGVASSKIAERTLPQRLLVQSARKISEDVCAASRLLMGGFAGPSYALLRMCRESLVPMLYLAFAVPAEANRYARYIDEQKPALAHLKLHREVTSLLQDIGDKLPQATQARFAKALLPEERFQHDEQTAKQDLQAPIDFTFKKLVRQVTGLLIRDHGNEAASFLTIVLDYWLESEVIHGGTEALEAYCVDQKGSKRSLDRIRDIVTSLLHPRYVATLTNTSLLTGLNAVGAFSLPPEVAELINATNSADEFLQQAESSLTTPPQANT